MKYRENAQVLENVRIGTDIYSLKLKTEKIAALAKPGQFVSVYTKDSAHLLPRPISVCEADESGVCVWFSGLRGKEPEHFPGWKRGDGQDRRAAWERVSAGSGLGAGSEAGRF